MGIDSLLDIGRSETNNIWVDWEIRDMMDGQDITFSLYSLLSTFRKDLHHNVFLLCCARKPNWTSNIPGQNTWMNDFLKDIMSTENNYFQQVDTTESKSNNIQKRTRMDTRQKKDARKLITREGNLCFEYLGDGKCKAITNEGTLVNNKVVDREIFENKSPTTSSKHSKNIFAHFAIIDK